MILGTWPVTILWAKPSDMAVLPTPGSPIKIGLFFVLRIRIWISLSISLSLPITGSILLFSASLLRFTAYLVTFSDKSSLCPSSLFSSLNKAFKLFFTCSFSTPDSKNIIFVRLSSSASIANRTFSSPADTEPYLVALSLASSKICLTFLLYSVAGLIA